MKGLEPPRLTAPDPKSGAAANYATSAYIDVVAEKSDLGSDLLPFHPEYSELETPHPLLKRSANL
jgi:hypothetical protein